MVYSILVMDKDLAINILDAIEDLYLENKAYRSLLRSLHPQLPPSGLLNRMLDNAREELREQVRQQIFAPAREHILQSHDLEMALQGTLQAMSAKKVN